MSRLPTVLLSLLLLPAAACPGPEPVYNEDIDLEAVPVQPGELAGTWAVKHAFNTWADIPIVGRSEAWGDTYLLMERTYDEQSGSYAQTLKPCWGSLASENNVSYIPDDGWLSVPAQAPRGLEARDDDGFYSVDAHLELWGLEGLDDPYDDPIPVDENEADEARFADMIVDMDDDGKEGMTLVVEEGFYSGELYFVQRKKLDLEGVMQGPDKVVGLLTPSFESCTISLETGGPIVQGKPQHPHEDPKANWFEEVRLPDGADCTDVIAAKDDELLSKFTPF